MRDYDHTLRTRWTAKCSHHGFVE